MLALKKDESCLKKMKEFYGACSSMYHLDRWVWGTPFTPHDDIFYLPVDHPDVQQVKAVTTDVSLGDDVTVQADLDEIYDTVKSFLASASRAANGKQPFSKRM